MASLRRNATLKSVLSNVKNRVEFLEGSRGSGLSSAGAVSAVNSSIQDDENTQGVDGVTSSNELYTYKKITKAYIYGDHVTGGFGPRVELYFEDDPEVTDGDYISLQGIRATSQNDFELSPKSFKVYDIDSPPWNDDVRATQSWRDTPSTGNDGSTVNYTVWFNPVVEVPTSYPASSGRELITTRRIDSITASNTTVTVNLNANHAFEQGDVIAIDDNLPSTLQEYSGDRLAKITSIVDSNTFTYTLQTALVSPVTINSGTYYIYPVAGHKVEDGATWNDDATGKVYSWKEYRWYDITEGVEAIAEKDGIAPSPVTNLASTVDLTSGTNGIIIPTIELTWTAPTTRSNGSSLANFLDGYEVWYKSSGAAVWTKYDAGTETGAILSDPSFRQNVNYTVRVYAVDIYAQYSTPAEITVTTSSYSETLLAPSAPTITSKLGTLKVYWDGTDTSGNLPVPGVIYVEYHYSTTSGFTPSSSTLYQTQPITSGSNYAIFENLAYSTTYYFQLVLVRSDGFNLESSNPSTEVSGTVTPLVNTDIIGQILDGAKIVPGSIVASDSILANSITANTIAANAITAGKILANSITADKIDTGAITAYLVEGETIRTANTGARVELTNGGIYAYGSGGGGPVFAFNTSTETLTVGGYATSNDLTTGLNGKVSGTLVGGAWSTSITGNSITTGTITGITVRTAASGTRTELSGTNIQFYYGASQAGTISGTQTSVTDYQTGTSFLDTVIELNAGNGSVNINAANGLHGYYCNMFQFSGYNFYVQGRLSVNDIRRYTSNGQITFTTTAGTTRAYVDTSNGAIGASSFVNISTRRYKSNINPYSFDEDALLNLPVITYQLDPQKINPEALEEDSTLGPVQIGLIAEEVSEAGLTELITYNDNDSSLIESMDYARIGVLLIPVVKKLREELNDLKTRVDAL